MGNAGDILLDRLKGAAIKFIGPGGLIIIFILALFMCFGIASQEQKNTSGVTCTASGEVNTKKIDDVLSKAGAFAGQREAFEKVAEKYKIDPVLMIAISIHETGWGKSQAVMVHNNPSGQMIGSEIIHFDTLEEGLDMTGKTINNLWNERGLNTLEKLGSAYAPIGAANDPTGLNVNWVPTISKFIEELGGMSVACTKEPTESPSTGNSGVATTELPVEYVDKVKFPRFDGKNYNVSGSYPVGQCTWYVFCRMAQLGLKVDDYMGNGGAWRFSGIAKGYTVHNSPKVGTAVSFPAGVAGADGTYGHVAFVEYVNSDGSILISESNVINDRTVSYRVIDGQTANTVAYIEGK